MQEIARKDKGLQQSPAQSCAGSASKALKWLTYTSFQFFARLLLTGRIERNAFGKSKVFDPPALAFGGDLGKCQQVFQLRTLPVMGGPMGCSLRTPSISVSRIFMTAMGSLLQKAVIATCSRSAFMVVFGHFHDSCIREAHLWTGHWVSPTLSMACSGDLDTRIRFLIQRQFKNPSAIELQFEEVTRFNLVPTPENYDSIIYSATLLVQDKIIFWSLDAGWDPSSRKRRRYLDFGNEAQLARSRLARCGLEIWTKVMPMISLSEILLAASIS